MVIKNKDAQAISSLLKEKIRYKLVHYSPETQSMPFHFRLLGKDRMALYSFIHSVNTMLGQSIFEKVAEIIAKPNFEKSQSQHSFEGYLSDKAVLEIDKIMLELKTAKTSSNEILESKRLQSISGKGKIGKLRKARVDLFLQKDNIEYFFEIKNSQNQNAKVKTCICIPYNPEAPNPYSRWTLQGMYDLKNEVFVAEGFWDFLGGKGTFEELLGIFEKTGIELREEIDKRFSEF